jgi:hypothetical protein
MAIVALGGLEICDGGHWLIVMKKGQRHGLSESLEMLPPPSFRFHAQSIRASKRAEPDLAMLQGSERNGLITGVTAQPLRMMQRKAAQTAGGILLAACYHQCWPGRA